MPPTHAVAGSLFLSDNFPVLLEDVVFEGGQFRLPEYKVLAILGADAQSFLNNQTTNNLNTLAPGHFHLSSVLDISARVIGFFHLLKVGEEELFLVGHKELFDGIVERLEKYLIAEDVELSVVEKTVYGVIGFQALEKLQGGFRGLYAEESAAFTFKDPELPEVDAEKFHILKTITGYPVWKETIHDLELINNTMLIELAYAKDKGCFLGQETVAKIETRKGAAFKPVLVQTDKEINLDAGCALKADGKKIGKFISQAQGNTLAALNRESRIEGLLIKCEEPVSFEGRVKYLPLYNGSGKADAYFHHGVELFQKGDEAGAEKYLLMSIQVDPAYEDPYESLGVLYGRQERFEDAIEYMKKLSELNQKSVMAHTNMSLYYMKIGEIEKAEDQKSKATIKQFQQLGEEADTKRRLEEEEKRKKTEIEKREAMFREVLDIDPEDTLANYGLGEIEYLKENFEASISHLQKAIEHKKNYSVAWLALGKSFLASEQKDRARETFRKGIEIAGKNGDLMPANEMQRLLGSLA